MTLCHTTVSTTEALVSLVLTCGMVYHHTYAMNSFSSFCKHLFGSQLTITHCDRFAYLYLLAYFVTYSLHAIASVTFISAETNRLNAVSNATL